MRSQFTKDGFFSAERIFDHNDFTDNKLHTTIPFLEKGSVIVRIKSGSGATENDAFSFSLKTGDPDCPCCTGTTRHFSGTATDSTWSCAIDANRWLRYEYTLQREFMLQSFRDSVFIEPGVDTPIFVEY